MKGSVFVVAVGSDILGQSETREDGLGYLKENYGEEKFTPDKYFPKCQGILEEFSNSEGDKKIRIVEVMENGINLENLLKEASSKKVVRIPKPLKPEKLTACTPTRTRLVTGKKTPPIPASRLPEGTVKLGNDGSTWINKKKGNEFKWVKYYEETHEGLQRKRKAPRAKAKEFREGTVMVGEDQREWIVKKTNTGKYKWVRNN